MCLVMLVLACCNRLCHVPDMLCCCKWQENCVLSMHADAQQELEGSCVCPVMTSGFVMPTSAPGFLVLIISRNEA